MAIDPDQTWESRSGQRSGHGDSRSEAQKEEESKALTKALNPDLTDKQLEEHRKKVARGEDPGNSNGVPKDYDRSKVSRWLDR